MLRNNDTPYVVMESIGNSMEEEPVLLAYCWESMDGDTDQVDVDGDGIDDLICNVQWMADGERDVFIYHYDGEKIWQGGNTGLCRKGLRD